MTDQERQEIISILTSENTGDIIQCMHQYGVQKYNQAITEAANNCINRSGAWQVFYSRVQELLIV